MVAAAATITLAAHAPAAAAGLQLTPVQSFAGDYPIAVTAPPGDVHRVFVVLHSGKVQVIKDGTLLGQPFLDISGQVETSGEQGLLSIAFPPDYGTSGKFYAFYSGVPTCMADPGGGQDCDDHVDEFRVSTGNPDQADPASSYDRHVLLIPHHNRSNHHGGQLQFGPDGYLYITTGDDQADEGPAPPPNTAQDLGGLHGKLLRIDPRPAGSAAYAVPPDNPFVGQAGDLPEIWAYGLRNPWRFSFDHLTGDLALPDVGQDAWEEVNFQPAGQGRGANYGWDNCEGDSQWALGPPCPPTPYTPPVLTYAHPGPGPVGCEGAIIGGYVVRDLRLPSLDGRYLYGDYCHGFINSAVLSPGAASPHQDAGLGALTTLVSFGQDGLCQVYVAQQSSATLFRIDPTDPNAPAAGCHVPPPPTPPGSGAISQAPPGPGGAADRSSVDRTPPVVTLVSMARRRFAVGKGPTAIKAVARGTAFRFTLSEAGAVTIRLDRARLGRRVGRRCLAATRARGRRPGCTRLIAAGSLSRDLAAGRRSVPFSGRIGRRALAPGFYRATITDRDGAGNASRQHVLPFTIVAG
jgi:glucose/arabinose dehydrogenase